jgi:cellulose synthase/poly-beta-1,6-N-acetylglucosamine synthase-like glycosyltransferase
MTTTEVVVAVVDGFSVVFATYFVAFGLQQMLMAAISTTLILFETRRRHRRYQQLPHRVASPPTVSIIVPAYNESLTIVDSVRSLFALDYEHREIVVVNDGSQDSTLPVLTEAFQLVPAPVAFEPALPCRPLRGTYRSMSEVALVVIDKENGGSKADALNAGINVASGELVLVVDADGVLEPDSVTRGVLRLLEDPAICAVGGIVGIANGCRIVDGRITEVALPRNWLARFQVVEYLRAFLLVRVARASGNALTIVSGAYGLFKRQALVAVGGFNATAIGEDFDITIALHRLRDADGRRHRIAADPFLHCSTQAPEDLASLRAQRCRWRRGLLQALWRHRGMIGNPRYGALGLLVLPYTLVFEAVAPLLEMSGYLIVAVAAVTGVLDWQHAALLVAVALLSGMASTFFAVLLSDLTTRRYMRGRDLRLLMLVALVEGVGYRQLNAWWGCVGTWQAIVGVQGWGAIKRREFEGEQAAR